MKKRILLTLLVCLLITVPALAGAVMYTLYPVQYPVLVEGERMSNSGLPVMTYKANGGDNTYVPLKAVLEMMGAKADWNEGKVNITTENKWDAKKLNDFLYTQYSVVIVKADMSEGTSQGSGFAVLDGSYIVTNAHVIYDDEVIEVRNFTEKEYHDYDVILKDDNKDIAVLKSKDGHRYEPLKLGDSDEVDLGHELIAFGYPGGKETQCTTSTGRVYGFGVYDGDGSQYIISSVDTSPGSSGGALLNEKGEVVGITAGASENLNSAIQINGVKKLLETIN